MTLSAKTCRALKFLGLCGALSAAFAVAACTSSLTLTPTAKSDVQVVLNNACPLLAAVQPNLSGASKQVRAAASVLAEACPPNPPPTNVIVAAEDLFLAYQTLSEFIHKN